MVSNILITIISLIGAGYTAWFIYDSYKFGEFETHILELMDILKRGSDKNDNL